MLEESSSSASTMYAARAAGEPIALGLALGIGRRDLHRRRDHLRILRDRQNGERTKSQQRHERAEHGRESGTVDKEMCQAHFAGSALILTGGRVPDRAILRLDLGARRRIGQRIDDDPVFWSEAGPDDP